MGKIKQAAQRVMLASMKLYGYALSPFMVPCCRFWPSCSEYAVDAVQQYGSIQGGWLIIKRITKCHPWHPGGVDIVPSHLELKSQCKHHKVVVND